MICSSANCRTISQIAFCSSVMSRVSTAMRVASLSKLCGEGGDNGARGDLLGMDRDISIAHLAARQQGNVSREQILALGGNDNMIYHRVRASHLHRVFPGVYSVGRPPIAPLERAAAA